MARVRRKGHRLREQLSEQEFWTLLLIPECQHFVSEEERRRKFGLLLAELERIKDTENAERIRGFLKERQCHA